jgi:hypothetical protein
MLVRYSIRILLLTTLIVISIIFTGELSAQSKPYRGPTDESGEVGARRFGLMNGNRILLRFSNRISLGGWPNPNESLWPNDDTGLNTLDEFNLILGNMVFMANDSIPVTDEAEIQTRHDLDTLWFAQSSSMIAGFEDTNPQGTVAWAFEPVYGYFNRNQDYPAMSNRSESWPTDGWPIEGLQKDWAGEWKGRYGRGKVTAELEAYYAANDAQDQENLQSVSFIKYYPRPGVRIGDIHPEDITQQKGLPWGGLGLRVEVRAYQWNNQQARDAIFFEYAISNISDYDLPRSVFGFYLDASNGNKAPNVAAEDQIGFFDKLQDLSYTWSLSGTGFGGGKPPISGWAFLESPSISNDGTDNDDDGLIDERRDNPASQIIGPMDGIVDLQKFLAFYNLKESQLRPHWDADEDQDWRDGNDGNDNGVYDVFEDAGDDVGNDGVAPQDLNYNGPDADGSECNHKPDFDEGLNSGEPNFGLLDVSESDMLGLTSFHMFPHPQFGAPQLLYDKECYRVIAEDTLVEFFGTPTNLYSAFGSGTFRFSKGRTERLSMAQVNSYEELAGLNSSGHSAPSLYTKKKVVQGIYETDYRFAKAPFTPSLTAKAGDGRVYLYWNDIADRLTREPFLQGANDFEGYKLYRATDKHFRDAEVLYDAYGNAAGKKPIFQCDLKDSITGTPPHTFFNGLGYNLGDDSGLQHFFIDETVENGRTYYYALVAYDYGIADSGRLGVNITPTENEIVIDLDENENINFTGINVQAVAPSSEAIGFESGITVNDPGNLQSDAVITPIIFNLNQIKPDDEYKIKFDTVVVDYLRTGPARHERDRFVTTKGYSIYNVSEGNTLIYHEDFSAPVANNWLTSALQVGSKAAIEYPRPNSDIGMTSEVFEGLQVFIKPNSATPRIDFLKSGWVTGNTPIDFQSNPVISQFFAYNYDIVFSDSPYNTKTTVVSNSYPVLDLANNRIPNSRVLLNNSFPFYVINKSAPLDSTGNFEKLDLIVHDIDSNGVYNPSVDFVIAGYHKLVAAQTIFTGTVFGFRFPEPQMPKTGDVFRVDFFRPLQDSIMFKVNLETLNIAELKSSMNNIKVVPNPYIVTNTMEPAVNQSGFNQQRRLMFTHLPAQSTIKIFTSSGIFIQELIVENQPDDGTMHWDMLTKEGLEIAAGVYVYLVESKVTGEKKIGKFAVVK